MSSTSRNNRCSACGDAFAPCSAKASAWDRSPWSDEYSDTLYQCAACGAWTLVTFVDRFASPEELKVRGPLSEEEAAEQLERMRK